MLSKFYKKIKPRRKKLKLIKILGRSIALYNKSGFLSKIFSLNVTKSAENDLVTSTEEIHNGKLYFCAVLVVLLKLLT